MGKGLPPEEGYRHSSSLRIDDAILQLNKLEGQCHAKQDTLDNKIQKEDSIVRANNCGPKGSQRQKKGE